VDHSARVQTVHEQTNPRFHALLSAINDPRPKGRGIQNSASWRSSWSFR
jgi:predicted NodU family carbamoyl transferase